MIAASNMYLDVVALRLLTHWMKLKSWKGSMSDRFALESEAATFDVRCTRSVRVCRLALDNEVSVSGTVWDMYGSRAENTPGGGTMFGPTSAWAGALLEGWGKLCWAEGAND